MEQTILPTLQLMFVFTGLLACLNAWLNKWGAVTAMMVLCAGAMATALALGGSRLSLIPALVLGCILLAIWVWSRPRAAPSLDISEDPKVISDRLLVEMEHRVAERRRLRQRRALFSPDGVRDHGANISE